MGEQFAARLDAVFGGLGGGQGAKQPMWQVSGRQLTRPGRDVADYSSEEEAEDRSAPEPLMKGDVMASDGEDDGLDGCRMAPSAAYSKWVAQPQRGRSPLRRRRCRIAAGRPRGVASPGVAHSG
jgi:hypothetical protein